MRKRHIWMICAVLAFVAAIGCLLFIWGQQREREETRAMYERMRQEMRPSSKENEETQGEGEEEEEKLVIPVDFEELWKVNPDIYAWITIPGTEVDYPVVQNEEDDSFYLTRTVQKEEGAAGAIFTEHYNSKDFSDPNTVLYGHNMKDGTMFAGLHQYEDETFWEEHQNVTIYTPDAIRHYRIFAAYLYDSRHLLQSFDCTDKEIYQAYLDEVLGQRNMTSVIDEDVQVTTDDRILTLSTCHSMGNDYRYLVQAVLIQE